MVHSEEFAQRVVCMRSAKHELRIAAEPPGGFFQEGDVVEIKWASWKKWHIGTISERYESMYLVVFDANQDCSYPETSYHPGLWMSSGQIRAPGSGGTGVTVSGAGAATVNGLYNDNGQYSGASFYECEASGMQIWKNGTWRMGTTNNYFYMCNDENPIGGNWYIASSQRNPEVSEGSSLPILSQ